MDLGNKPRLEEIWDEESESLLSDGRTVEEIRWLKGFQISAMESLAVLMFDLSWESNDKKYWGQFIAKNLDPQPLFKIVIQYYYSDDDGLEHDFKMEVNRQIENDLNITTNVYRALYENQNPDMGVDGLRDLLWETLTKCFRSIMH